MRKILLLFFILLTINVFAGFTRSMYHFKFNSIVMTDTSLLKRSEQLLYNVKTGVPTEEIEFILAGKDINILKTGLN
ncbi:MAG: hypothetical protein KGL19_00525, partial [Bacteroidota bacterium]|nr:hypothetical protein [Bacteroidota bacterium]